MKIIRIFPRKTNATPDDDMVRFGTPGIFDEADEIHISVTFEHDKEKAEWLAYQWEQVAPVKIGGVAYNDPGNEFEPGMYLKKGYVITSRGCPNKCWFCKAWKNEGNEIRELEIKDGYNILDNNILACSKEHQEKVFKMLMNQPRKARFTGGFEAKRFTDWHVGWLLKLKPKIVFFAYDTPDDYEPLIDVSKIIRDAGLFNGSHVMRCYVLIGYKDDTIEKAEKRLQDVLKLGFMPFAMRYKEKDYIQKERKWNLFQREWTKSTIVGSKMKLIK